MSNLTGCNESIPLFAELRNTSEQTASPFRLDCLGRNVQKRQKRPMVTLVAVGEEDDTFSGGGWHVFPAYLPYMLKSKIKVSLTQRWKISGFCPICVSLCTTSLSQNRKGPCST